MDRELCTFYILKRLLNSPEIEYVVNACDAGREGELIFKHVYDLSGSKKPVKRLWISSLEDSAILDGMQHLRSAEEYRHLAEAAVCRSQADWLVGMNATRAYTTKYFKKLTVGRVQTPTLPLMMPAFTIGLFLSISSSFKMFDQNLALTQGGPYKSTEMIALNIYNSAFGANEFGFAQAKAIVFLIIVAGIGVTQLVITKRKEVEM